MDGRFFLIWDFLSLGGELKELRDNFLGKKIKLVVFVSNEQDVPLGIILHN